jgi:hypothetical protein
MSQTQKWLTAGQNPKGGQQRARADNEQNFKMSQRRNKIQKGPTIGQG